MRKRTRNFGKAGLIHPEAMDRGIGRTHVPEGNHRHSTNTGAVAGESRAGSSPAAEGDPVTMAVEAATTMTMMTDILGDPAGEAQVTAAQGEGGRQAEAAHQATHQAVPPAGQADRADHLWTQDSALSGKD